jgi:DNA-binding HxlR family transcriptional regulator
MASKKTKNYIDKNCSGLIPLTLVRETMQLLSGKWKMQIVTFLLNNGKTRFMDLMRGVEGDITETIIQGITGTARK